MGRNSIVKICLRDMPLDAVQLMLLNIGSEQQGNWTLHMHTVAYILLHIFVTNRTNYFRWIPVYLLEMSQIPLDIQTAFEGGEFSFTEIPGSFNGIWSDIATEKTVIKNAKGDGGIVGLTRKKPAVIRWTLTRHMATQYSAAMKERSGITSANTSVNQQEKAASMKQGEDHVKALISHLKNNITNSFDCSFLDHNVLINISTGMHATKEGQSSLLNAVKNGKVQMEAFVTRTFWSPREKVYTVQFQDRE